MESKTIFEWAEMFQEQIQNGASKSDIIQMLEEYGNQALRIHDVVGRSEQFYCTCSRAKGLDHDEEGIPYCIECQKIVQ